MKAICFHEKVYTEGPSLSILQNVKQVADYQGYVYVLEQEGQGYLCCGSRYVAVWLAYVRMLRNLKHDPIVVGSSHGEGEMESTL